MTKRKIEKVANSEMRLVLERFVPSLTSSLDLLIIGDDQHEVFHDNNMPAISVYGGETVQTRPRASGTGHPLLINSYRAHGEMDVKTYPVASELAKNLIEHLIE